MSAQSRGPPVHAFSLRLWPETIEDDKVVWRGRMQDLATGEVRYFQGWEALVDVLLSLMEEEV